MFTQPLWSRRSKAPENASPGATLPSTSFRAQPPTAAQSATTARSSDAEYWSHRLGNVPLAIDLPIVEQADHDDAPGVATPEFDLGDDASRRLHLLARGEVTEVFTVLLAAWQMLLFRYGGQQDFVIGCAMPGGKYSVPERPLLVHATVAGADTFRQLVRRTAQRRAEGADRAEASLEQLVAALAQGDLPRERHPIFQTAVMQRHRLSPQVSRATARDRYHPCELVLAWEDTGTTIRGRLEYPAGGLNEAAAKRAPVHFCNLLRSAIALPDAPITTLPMRTAAEYAAEKAQQSQQPT